MGSFWPLLCRIVVGFDGILGVTINIVAIAVLWNRKMRVGWSTYRVGMTVSAVHGVLFSTLIGASSLCFIFHKENTILILYGINSFLSPIANDIILFAIITVAIGIWELIPANCILQYLALPQYSNSKRLLIAFSTCASLVVVPMPVYNTLYAPPDQIKHFERLTRDIHNHTDNDSFVVYGAFLHPSDESNKSIIRFAKCVIIPTYCISYGIFIVCCVNIYRAINAFGTQLSTRTLAMQRGFLGMLITQGLLPLAILSIPVGCFLTAVVTGMAMDLYSLILPFSMWPLPSVQGAVSLSYVIRMKPSTSVENTIIGTKSRTCPIIVNQKSAR